MGLHSGQVRWTCLTLLLAAAPAAAQTKTLPVVKFTIRPTAAPEPALKYQLLPPLKDQSSGNAALLYQRAHSPEWLNHRRRPEYKNEEMYKWEDMPLKDLPRDKMRWLETYRPLKEVDLAARREYCDWELTPRLRKDGIGLLLPDIQFHREFATLLALRARLAMAEGKFDKAVYSLQTGFAEGRDVAQGPTLINALVGFAISNVMLNQVEEMIRTPGSPNLYWALASLPRPLIPLRRGIQGEELVLEAEFPGVRTIETERLTPREEKAWMERLIRFHSGMVRNKPASDWQSRMEMVGLIMKAYPAAKQALIAGGRTAKEVEALPALQVVVIQAVREFKKHRDNMFKWFYLPYSQGEAGLAEVEKEIKKARASLDTLPVFIELLPAVQKVKFAETRLDRRIAALRCVEAIRLYAAAHHGKLPARLDDVDEVPIPRDPVTAKSFEYKVTGDHATLYGPPPKGQLPMEHNTINFQLALKR
jgi:hypothetical protein